jgi:hypothetical protein
MAVDAKVAKVISSHEVAFNAGSDQGVEIDDIAAIVTVIDITDPDTGEKLGAVRRPLIRFTISTVGDKFSVGRSMDLATATDAFSGLFTTTSPTLKTVTGIRSEAGRSTIYVEPGMEARITKPAESK